MDPSCMRLVTQRAVLPLYYVITLPEDILWSGYSGLSTQLHLGLTKTQMAGYTWEGLFLIESFGVGRPTLCLDLWRWKYLAEIWPTPSLVSLCNEHKRRKGLHFACLPSLSLANSFLHWHYAYFFRIPASIEDQRRHPASQDWTAIGLLDLPLEDSHCWNSREP